MTEQLTPLEQGCLINLRVAHEALTKVKLGKGTFAEMREGLIIAHERIRGVRREIEMPMIGALGRPKPISKVGAINMATRMIDLDVLWLARELGLEQLVVAP